MNDMRHDACGSTYIYGFENDKRDDADESLPLGIDADGTITHVRLPFISKDWLRRRSRSFIKKR